MRRRAAAALVLVVLAPACADQEASSDSEAQAPALVGETPAPDPVETRVFMREPVPQAGEGRVVLHVLVPGDATREQIRQALIRTMEDAAAADTALVAARAVAYVVSPPRVGQAEADLVPIGWGEWLPPGGWVGPASRGEVHRFYTYQGVAPEW